MQINIETSRLELTDAIKEYLHKKLAKVQTRITNVSHIDCNLFAQKHEFKIEAKLHFLGAEIFAEAIAKDMYAAIDFLEDKLLKLITKHKEKNLHHK